MTLAGSIISIVPGLQATAVAGRGLALIPKKFGAGVKGGGKKMVGGFVDIIVGVGLIKPTANIAAGL